ncbi:Ribosomal protein S18 acetylase RimI [Microbacterium sp. cf046]|uniref:GNAT family N-acetyltransferase n=1 Tax=Microbacterium sp. cf046 TaxID=1761803 RepID=UPI0008E43509|nr:GNAT family N-acetyltransferase [Microbacterium sp. cf046]SFS07249.1 Ribosomal protein S18 acetylase RimI [Microbacterium sp. cf046]
MTTLSPLTADDHDDWLALWWAYLEFYETALSTEQTELTFARLVSDGDAVHGAIARNDAGHAIGFVNWLTHPSTWADGPYCYLEDLYVHPGARGGGTGGALIAYVRAWAERSGCDKLYWLTQRSNHKARELYDRVAQDTGFMHYEIDLATIAGDFV